MESLSWEQKILVQRMGPLQWLCLQHNLGRGLTQSGALRGFNAGARSQPRAKQKLRLAVSRKTAEEGGYYEN